MKRYFVFLVMVFCAMSVNAQWFLGGSAGIRVGENEEKIGVKTTGFGVNIVPKFGYYFNEKFALGLDVSTGCYFLRTTYRFISEPDWEYYVSWKFNPFIRYSVFTYKKFSLTLEGSVGVSGRHYIFEPYNISKYSYSDNFTIYIYVFNVSPLLCFQLTDHLQLETGLHFFDIGYDIGITDGGVVSHNFNTVFNSFNILSTSHLTIGAIYKF